MSKTVDEITTEMMEYICDNLCVHPFTADQEELDAICDECKMAQFIDDILIKCGDK